MTESLDALVGELQGTLAGHRNQFVQWLQRQVQGIISVEGPVAYDNGRHEETYVIRLDDSVLGEYKVMYVLSDERTGVSADEKREIRPPQIISAKVSYQGRVPGYEHPFAEYLRLEGRAGEITPELSLICVDSEYDRIGSKPQWRQPAHVGIPFRVQ